MFSLINLHPFAPPRKVPLAPRCQNITVYLRGFACTSLNTKYSSGCMEVSRDEIIENRKLALILGMNASILMYLWETIVSLISMGSCGHGKAWTCRTPVYGFDMGMTWTPKPCPSRWTGAWCVWRQGGVGHIPDIYKISGNITPRFLVPDSQHTTLPCLWYCYQKHECIPNET